MYRELSLTLARAFHHNHFVPLLHFEIEDPLPLFLPFTNEFGRKRWKFIEGSPFQFARSGKRTKEVGSGERDDGARPTGLIMLM